MKLIKKKIFFNLHSWIGTQLSILIFIVCFSGTLATLSHEMDWLFNPAIRASPQEELASRNLIISNFKEVYPEGQLTFWMRTDEPYLCDILYKSEGKRKSYVFANPYTGEIQGEVQITFQRFFRDLHYYLFIPFQVGNYIVLVFGFLLLISLGTALFFYKKWWRKLFELKTGKGLLVLFRSLHRLVGVWSVPFTLLFSITGIWYFIERANVGNVGDKVNPESPELNYTKAETDSLKNKNSLNVDYDRAINSAKQAIPDLRAGTINVNKNYVYITGKSSVPLVRQRANRVFINPLNYQTMKVQNAEDISAVMYLNDIADPLHFGYWGGITTKIIWFIFGLSISSLILTGIWISLKRKARSRKKMKHKVIGVWCYINWGVFALIMIYMYYNLINRYNASSTAIITISLGWGIFIALACYIFVYRLKKVVIKTG